MFCISFLYGGDMVKIWWGYGPDMRRAIMAAVEHISFLGIRQMYGT